jgi:hypothetical protein
VLAVALGEHAHRLSHRRAELGIQGRVAHAPGEAVARDHHGIVHRARRVSEDLVVAAEAARALARREPSLRVDHRERAVAREASCVDGGAVERLAAHGLHGIAAEGDDAHDARVGAGTGGAGRVVRVA